MAPAAKLARFAVILGVAFGLGWGIGAVIGPIVEPPPPAHEHPTPSGSEGG